MVFKPIKTKKIYEEIADTLISMIKSGQLKPGDKIDSIEQLALSFAVSRSAIREALSGLRAMGLIEMKQGEGTYVARFDPKHFQLPITTAFIMKQNDVKELLEVRKILEVGAVSAAAIKHNETDLIRIKEALIQMEYAQKKGDLGERADYQFHVAVAEASHNRMLINLLNSVSEIMQETMRESRKLTYYSKGSANHLQKEHQRIYEAIKDRDADLAEKHMLHHLKNVENLLINYIENEEV